MQPASRCDVEDRASAPAIPLGRCAKGTRGSIVRVGADAAPSGAAIAAAELERRLLEIGFVEGARVEILHEGPIGHDPIAVRLEEMRVALRRQEADAILIRPIPDTEA